VVPAFMQDLYLQLFHSDGSLRDCPDVNVILAIRQALKGLSKVKQQCRKDRISNEVVNFINIEASIPTPALNWEGVDLYDHRICGDSIDIGFCVSSSSEELSRDQGSRLRCTESSLDDKSGLEPRFANTLQTVSDIVASSMGDFYTEQCEVTGELLIPKHGRGRVSNRPKGVSKYSFYEWPDKLDFVFPYDYYAVHDSGLVDSNPRVTRLPGEYSSPSKLIAVPKTLKGPRLIASEPSQNQWIQQLMLKQINSKVKVNKYLNKAIKFESQEQNASLALTSSHSGSHATIDLSSASDRFSLWTLERMFRKNPTFLERFHACRTSVIKNEIDDNFDVLTLKKAFSQGNALTFPVQSIGYTIICIAAVLETRNLRATPRNIENVGSQVSVYGDDMIVPIDSFDSVCTLLEAVGLKVNPDKTFQRGKFRESCGTDAFDGVIVTPSYVKILSKHPRHETAVSAIESSNNLISNGWWHLANFQESLLGSLTKRLPIIAQHEQILGLKSFSGRSTSHLRTRYSPDLHRLEYNVETLVAKPKVVDHELGTSHFFQWQVEKPSIDLLWVSGVIDSSSAVMRRGWKPLYESK